MTTVSRSILIADGGTILERIGRLFEEQEFQVDSVFDETAAFRRLAESDYDLVLIDEELRPHGGTGFLSRLRQEFPDLPVIMFAANPELDKVVQAIRAGALDYIREDISPDDLKRVTDRAFAQANLHSEVKRLRTEVERVRGLGQWVAEAPVMRQLFALAERVARSDATVLILGESGTGKELMARMLHRFGPRADFPFVAFDCSALSSSLLEAELFGHEKGAFTGAMRARRGLFREASGGTIFLDEIGDIAPETQNKLLRVLQEREVKPVGGDQFIRVDVRVIAATNKDLKALVAQDLFREDLYWRLAVVPIQLPPLRERIEDIPLLAHHILAKRGRAAKTFRGVETNYPTNVTPAAMRLLARYGWPGNIRELENVLSRAAILCDGPEIDVRHLQNAGLAEPELTAAPVPAASANRPLKELVAEVSRGVEKHAISEALEKCHGSPAKAARQLAISRASIYVKMEEYGIVPNRKR